MPKKVLSPQQAEAVVEAYRAGEVVLAIASRFGITFNAVRYRCRKARVWQGRRLERPEIRFWRHVCKTATCWLWTGCTFNNRYGCFSIKGISVLAHRYSYTLNVGPIPDGLTIDHTCRNKSCVNPAHLEPVPIGINTKRGRDALGMKYELKTTATESNYGKQIPK